ncbi:serine hydroxymethyltransferase [bacterium]|nr:serine hydroxymethyltransferase [bacterium]
MALQDKDTQVYNALKNEEKRQVEGIELIASENYVSAEVLETMGTVFTNKYSEGYPGHRYYGGQEFVDVIENLARDRAKELFNAEYANVQPYSGSPANAEVYFALLEFGDKAMGMSLAMGGHLTHGHPKVTYSGRAYNFVQYGVDEKTHRLDYDKIKEMAIKEKPKMIVCGGSAYPREIDFKAIGDIAKEVGAISMADIAHIAGLIAGGAHQNAFPHIDVVTTTTHKTLRGPRGAMIMAKQEFGEKIDKAVFPGMQGGPHDHIVAAKAVAFKEALQPEFKEYAHQVVKNAQKLGEELMNKGYELATGGTDNHLILVDLTNKGATGKEAEVALDKVGITVNKNMIPYDKRSPFDPSGIRVGSAAATTRGMKENEMVKIASWIDEAVQNRGDEEKLKAIHQEVIDFCKQFPVPGI